MLAELKIGAELDIATGAEVADVGDSIVDRMSKRPLPHFYSFAASNNSAASATVPFELVFGSPPKGHMWDILGVTTFGSDDHTVVAGNVALYVGNATSASLLDLRVPALVIPFYDGLGRNRLWVTQGQTVYAMVSGVANSQIVGAIIHVSEWRAQDVIDSGAR